MKKLKLNLAQLHVLSFAVEMAKGGGTVNAHETEEFGGLFDTTVSTSGTDVHMSCSSCPRFCFIATSDVGC